MRTRLIVLGCLLLTILLITPQMAQPVSQDESIKEAVKPAIEAGVDFLRRTQLPGGQWAYQHFNDPKLHTVSGATALCGIALMECNVPTNDPQVRKAASVVRQAIASPGFNHTYTVALCLLFLDRLHRGQPNTHSDSGAIRAMAEMIAKGQAEDHGWGYHVTGGSGSDNSNTQFAVVALWVARKYAKQPGGLIDKALARTEKKMRQTQRGEGGWGYDSTLVQLDTGCTGSMTCSGILGIALSSGVKARSNDAAFRGSGTSGETANVVKELDTDPAIRKAKTYMMASFASYLQGTNREGRLAYFLWSLERVATLYKWRKINDIDWFELGSRHLMRLQNRDGSWSLDFMTAPVVDTSFCLLFLGKSNLLGDLQEAEFKDGAISGGPTIAPKKKTEPKKVTDEQLAKELATELLTANPKRQAEILNDFIEGKGNDFTYTLAEVIEKLSTNQAKDSAREALAVRMQKMKPTTLTKFLSADERELRLASAVAVRFNKDLSVASGLIPLLADPDIGISTAALESLKSLSGQDFGKSVERWSRWLEKANIKKP